ncbi:MAG: hypothetical protein JWO72_1228 [Caulobacteraceae bacterium]|nr:hypothetical protein [Caulobacteraceae bacterium]
MHKSQFLSTSTFLAAAGLLLTACDKPPANTQAAAPAGPASSATIRPASAEVVREPYRYIDDAYALGDAFGDSPPDYAIDYDGARPWIWRSRSGDYRVIERTSDGERDYYYRAGADQPFLVRDPRYAYAYDRGQLVVVYDSSGRPVSPSIAARDADVAARYLDRARRLYAAAVHEQRQTADAADWLARRDQVSAQQRQWAAEQQRNDDWRRWRDDRGRRDDQGRAEQAALGEERAQRQAYAAQVAGAAVQRAQDQTQIQRRADADRRLQAVAAGDDRRARDDADRREQASAQARQQQMQAPEGRRQQALAEDQARQRQHQAEQAQREQAKTQEQQQAEARKAQAEASRAQEQLAKAQAQQAQVQQAQAEEAKRVQAGRNTPGHDKGHGPGKHDDKDDQHEGRKP